MRKAGFSLMEMMVVLLIVAIIAAASAPMVSKKLMRDAGTSGSPWMYAGLNGSITYNPAGDENKIAMIGSSSTPSEVGETKLYIESNGDEPQVAFAESGGSNSIKMRFKNQSVALTNKTLNSSSFVAIGYNSESKSGSTAIGASSNASGSYATSLGFSANANGSYSTVLGYRSKGNSTYSTAVGPSANASGSYATAIGSSTKASNDAAALGSSANASSPSATAIGPFSRASSNAAALGRFAIASGSNSAALGCSANASGSDSAALGRSSNSYGANSVSIGRSSRASSTNSVALGYLANAHHTNSVAIGYDSETTASNQIVLGNPDTTVVIPGKVRFTGDVEIMGDLMVKNSFAAGDAAIDNRLIAGMCFNYREGTWGRQTQIVATGHKDDYYYHSAFAKYKALSDRRLKNVGEVFTGGLDKIKQLKVYNYTFKNDPDKTPQVGVMAQDLQKVFPKAVTKGEDGFLRIRWDEMFYALINAVKELDIRTANDTADLKKQNKELEKRIIKLEKELAELKKNK